MQRESGSPAAPVYRMSLDLNVLNHLGLYLYSNVAAVLSEAVANSWDADATKVMIRFDNEHDAIHIEDNGVGMTVRETNERFLKVGYSKRSVEGSKTPKGRPIMGRKGIGKLSLFSIAERVIVQTVRKREHHAFEMHVPAIEAAISAGDDYLPRFVNPSTLPPLRRGTRIVLSELKKNRTKLTTTALKKRIARRFSVISSQAFSVEVDSEAVTISDRDDLTAAQFVWEFGSKSLPKAQCPKRVKHLKIDDVVSVDGRDYRVSGWIGSAASAGHLNTADGGNLNSVVVLARGRLIQENILDRINMGGLFTKYLTGQIEADFLDIDNERDIATSDRQRIIEDDPRYLALEIFLRKTLNRIESEWTDFRNDLAVDTAQERYPALREWVESLPTGSRKHARKVIGRLEALTIEDPDRKREVLRHGVLAFERLRLREAQDQLPAAIDAGIDQVLTLLADMDAYEGSLYLDIIRNRVQEIGTLRQLTDNDEKERVIQQYLYDHLWLLDPSWERVEGTALIESKVEREFERINSKLSDAERRGRRDIKYRATAKRHVIVELKRSSVMTDSHTLVGQVKKYVSALRKILDDTGHKDEGIDVVCVVGRDLKDEDGDFVARQLDSVRARVVKYDELIESAYANYQAFVKRRAKVDKLEALFAK